MKCNKITGMLALGMCSFMLSGSAMALQVTKVKGMAHSVFNDVGESGEFADITTGRAFGTRLSVLNQVRAKTRPAAAGLAATHGPGGSAGDVSPCGRDCAGIPSFVTNGTIPGLGLPSSAGITPPPIMAAVPEPESYALFAAGLGLVAWAARRKARSLR